MKTRWLFGLLLSALAASAWAAEAPAEADEPKAAASPTPPTAEKPEKAEDAAPAPKEDGASKEAEEPPEAAEVFVPTEAISEDIAVPFPVDI